MEGYTPASYGDAFAEVYDRWYHGVTDAEACADRVAELATAARDADPEARPAGRPRVLELGVGTGRLALPLVQRGMTVTGVDTSTAMLDQLRGKLDPDASRWVQVVVGDMADMDHAQPVVPDEARFDAALVAYNTFFNLPSDQDQRRCLAGVARRLSRRGVVLVEAFVPVDDPDARRDDVSVSRITATDVVLSATLHDPEAQTITGQHIHIGADGIQLRPWQVHYLSPAQLDACAGAAGLTLVERWQDWQRSPYDDGSAVHISVYRV